MLPSDGLHGITTLFILHGTERRDTLHQLAGTSIADIFSTPFPDFRTQTTRLL